MSIELFLQRYVSFSSQKQLKKAKFEKEICMQFDIYKLIVVCIFLDIKAF